MDRTRRLISNADIDSESVAICSDCGVGWGTVPPVEIGLLRGTTLRRCLHCGTRWTADGTSSRRILTCTECELPFPEETDSSTQRCGECRSGRFGIEVEDGELTAATESEVRSSLAGSWRFVGSTKTSAYLDRVARDVAKHIPGAPVDCRVLLFDERSVRAMALPSGVLLLSSGALQALEDEAELAFVLGRELAHVASPNAARRLVRLGLRALGDGGRDEAGLAWTRAAVDLVRLGHGGSLEHDADAHALRAVMELGYDPAAPRHYLQRIDARIRDGAEELAEHALAHPPVNARLRRLDGVWVPAPKGSGNRINREVFRRAVGHSVLSRELVPVPPFDEPHAGRGRGRDLMRTITWTVLLISLLISLVLVFVLP